MISLTYSLFVWGDMHVGSGVGVPGYIDERVVRDGAGLAYIPASEIKGLVRQSCADLVYYRDEVDRLLCAGQGKWQALAAGEPQFSDYCAAEEEACLLCTLFGSPRRPGALWFSPARYEEEYRNSLESVTDPLFNERDGTTSAHAAIDPHTRRAEEHQLFNLEVVRPATRFAGAIETMEGLQPSMLANERLHVRLQGGLLFTRHLGGRRRRGWGRCRFELAGETLAPLRQWLGGEK